MQCRVGCGACCIAPSISSAIPGMPDGKPAGVRCSHLSDDHRCNLFGMPDRPKVCIDFAADHTVCGDTTEQALRLLDDMEQLTRVARD